MNIPAAKILFSDEDRRRILASIDETLRTGQLTLGPRTKEFEEKFAQTVDVPYAVAVSSGTAALEIILRAYGVAGREVIVPADTFFATAAAVVHAGGRPRFVDIEAETLGIDPERLEAAIRPETAGVVLVHIGGWISRFVDRIREVCGARNLFLVEDAAHAHGSRSASGCAGALGDAAAFSFYPTKVITSGEGGMITTRDPRIHQEAQRYRDQGKESFSSNFHTHMGANWRLSELHAAVGIAHLSHLSEWIDDRIRVARIYDALLEGDARLVPLPFPRKGRTNYYKYIVKLSHTPPGFDRKEFKRAVKERHGVGLAGEVYEVPCHQQPVFAPWRDAACPVAERFCAQHLCLPIYPGMTEAEATHVVRSIQQTLQQP